MLSPWGVQTKEGKRKEGEKGKREREGKEGGRRKEGSGFSTLPFLSPTSPQYLSERLRSKREEEEEGRKRREKKKKKKESPTHFSFIPY